ncbi:hypothetical protein HLH17_14535 [Acinetobacter sp. ANC 5380]|uniref:Uncharacterized protein n=1 Tax=Acinetobacter terrae TaxID=2731247 RepID=A0A7Y2RHP2_9GAMM|nr:hypothetical protein [Acinetobacter terrae]NNH78839.1 hypothetical protein [Acinetobacter terrae]
MNAYNFIINGVSNTINKDSYKSISCCKYCKQSEVGLLGVDQTCMACHFLQTPNSKYFGMLTGVRAHSPISFLNSLLVFDSKDGMTLVVSQKYADKIPDSECLKVVVEDDLKYISELLNNPRKMVILKPSIRYEEYANNLVISDKRTLYIASPFGCYWLNVNIWNNLNKLFKENENIIISKAIDLLINVSTGKVENTDLSVRDFVKKNKILVGKMNELLDMDIHSKIFMLKILKTVCNERI